MKILGFEHANLNFKDGSSTSGYFLYLHDEDAPKVTGIKTERLFITDKKMDSYVPKVGDKIKVYWNRYGKVDSVQRLSS